MGILHKLGQLSWPERRRLLEALIWLGVMQMAIQLLAFQRITRLMRLAVGEDKRQLASEQADEIGWAIRAVAAHTLWKSTCLAQALAGLVMLYRRDIPGTLYLGVAKGTHKSEAVPIDAHAWLSSGEKILVGGSVQAQFNTIAAFTKVNRQ